MVLDATLEVAIERATIRAKARNIKAQLVDTAAVGYDRTEFYEVGSFTRSGLMHHVALAYSSEGVEALCDCEAGQRGLVCQHTAAALMAESQPKEEPAPVITFMVSRSRLAQLMAGD